MSINLDLYACILPLSIMISVGIAAFFLCLFVVRKLFRRFMTEDEYSIFKRGRANIIIPLIVALLVIYIQANTYFKFAGDHLESLLPLITSWFTEHGVAILLIIMAAYILGKLLNLVIPPAIFNVTHVRDRDSSSQEEIRKRSAMLSSFLIHVGQVAIVIIAAFMVLSEFGIDITPMLAGAGIVGLAVGLGAQKFIGDLITGIAIIVDDYYSVGDVVKVAGIAGVVEEVNIRRTILRDLDGIVHIIPNSEIKIASNLTKNWSRVNINIPVSYAEDLDRVITVMNRVGLQLAQDVRYKDMVITAPQVLRVDNFADSAIEIKMLGDTKPMKQWEVTGELRKRIKKAFDEESIEIPWPHIKVFSGDKK